MIVAYFRLSKDNGKGLGLEAQQAIVQHFHKGNIVKAFTELKSAKNITDRPILREAIAYCLQHGYTLVVAKVDRLSRNVDDCRLILSQLDGKLLACDIPGTIDKFTLTLYAAFAERERELISLRTSQALQAKKRKMGKWHKGSPDIRERQKTAIEANKSKAANNPNNIRAMSVITDKRLQGLTLAQIAAHLNEMKFTTSTGKLFTPTQVSRLLPKTVSI